MKKLSAILLVSILLLMTVFPMTVSAESSASISAAFGTPVIDGIIDDIWGTTEAQTIDNVDKVVISSNTSTTGVLRVMWDEDYFYVLVEVDKHGIQVYQGEGGATVDVDFYDCAELNFALDGDFSVAEISSSLNENAGDVRVFPDGTITGFGPYLSSYADDIKAVMKVTDTDKYVAEYALPWSDVNPAAGNVIALEIQINDHSTPTRDGLVNWASEEGCWGWLKTSVCGKAILAAEAVPETEAPATEAPSPEEEVPPTSDITVSAAVLVVSFCAVSAGLIIRKKK